MLTRVFLALGALTIATMVLFPPWRYTVAIPRRDNIEAPGGYAFISAPPEPTQERCPVCWYESRKPPPPTNPPKDDLDKLLASMPLERPTPRQYQVSIRMDVERLAVQILGAGLACGLLALATRKKRS